MRKYVPSDYMVDAITNAIDEHDGEYVKAEDLPRWMPVSERLPELCERVLVVNADVGFVEVGFRHLVGEYQHWDGDDWEELHQPTHWMPLPEPPEVK